MNNNSRYYEDDKFSEKKFNNDFEKYKYIIGEYKKTRDIDELNELNKSKEKKYTKIYDLTLSEILVNIKDVWFEIIDDVLSTKITSSIFTKDNRLFYIGITIFVFAGVLYLYNILIDDTLSSNSNIKNPNTNITKVIYINRKMKINPTMNTDSFID